MNAGVNPSEGGQAQDGSVESETDANVTEQRLLAGNVYVPTFPKGFVTHCYFDGPTAWVETD